MPTAKANGLTIAYETSGDPRNPTILLVMGLGAQLTLWPDAFVEALAANDAAIRCDPRLPQAYSNRGNVLQELNRFAEALAVALLDALWGWRQEGVESIVRAWLPLGHPVGTPLRVSEQGLDGIFDGLAPDGALRLRRADGEVMLIHAGDVELQRPVKGN